MSVVCRSDLGAFLDHLQFKPCSFVSHMQKVSKDKVPGCEDSSVSCSCCGPSSTSCSRHGETEDHKVKVCYRWKRELFAVDSPFMMNSQAERIKRETINMESGIVIKETSAQRKRRKKSKKEFVLSEIQMKISQVIGKALPDLTEQAKELKCLHEVMLDPADNNQTARDASHMAGCGDLFHNLCCDFDDQRAALSPFDICDGDNKKQSHSSSHVIILRGDKELSYRSQLIIGRHVCNLDNTVQTIQVDSHKFLIPPLASFLTSSFRHFVAEGYAQIQVKKGYDLIVLDPPWINKSVKRMKSYHTVIETDLKEIPLGDLAGEKCLVCVWVTNNKRLQKFVTDELFPHWSVDFLAEWFWLKVTRKGEPVCDIQSTHKKPYEQLIIGQLTRKLKYLTAESYVEGVSPLAVDVASDIQTQAGRQPETSPALDICVNSTTKVKLTDISCVSDTTVEMLTGISQDFIPTTKEKLTGIPQDFLLVSVPSSLHSKKPSLRGVLSEYLPTEPSCLELFARNLTPGWVSWGDEPLLHQHLDYFEQTLESDTSV